MRPQLMTWRRMLSRGPAVLLSVGIFLAASLYQYQKHITLDGHVWSIHGYTINEKFYQGLSAVERKAVEEGTQKATAIHRKMTSDQDKNAKEIGKEYVASLFKAIAVTRK